MDCPLPQNRFLRGIYLMIQRYLRHNVGIQSAALAFYLLFTLFPLMIFISALLGLLDLNVAGILEALREICPWRSWNLSECISPTWGKAPVLSCCSLGCSSRCIFPCGQPML